MNPLKTTSIIEIHNIRVVEVLLYNFAISSLNFLHNVSVQNQFHFLGLIRGIFMEMCLKIEILSYVLLILTFKNCHHS